MFKRNINKNFDMVDPKVPKFWYGGSWRFFILYNWLRKKNNEIKMKKGNISTIFRYYPRLTSVWVIFYILLSGSTYKDNEMWGSS